MEHVIVRQCIEINVRSYVSYNAVITTLWSLCLKKGSLAFSVGHSLIFIIFGTNITWGLGNQTIFYFSTSPNWCVCTTVRNRKTQKSSLLTLMLLHEISASRCLISLILLTCNLYSCYCVNL